VVLSEPLAVTREVVGALDACGVDYLVGGSLASSLHGIPRATFDVDLVVQLDRGSVDPLVARLQGSFYVDPDSARDAVRRHASFNVIHLGTMVKLDQDYVRRWATHLGVDDLIDRALAAVDLTP